LFLVIGEPQAALLMVGHQAGAVESKFVDMEHPGTTESREHAIRLLDDVLGEVIKQGVQKALFRPGLPVIALEFVTGMAAVDQVGWRRGLVRRQALAIPLRAS
jgi:hypothetical protein